MYEIGDVINDRYVVEEVHSNEGGMGTLLLVRDQNNNGENRLALKYCKIKEDEPLNRFRREVRILNSFKNNGKVVQIYDSDLDHNPPYFVMKFYPEGDLRNLIDALDGDFEYQESIFNQMIECIAELHLTDTYHRDIKPQNFLVDNGQIIVSDLGLSMETGTETRFTRPSQYWGTPGYIPPEFFTGGFKEADEKSDIYMLGKSFYKLLTNRDPRFINDDLIPNPLLYIIEKCCDQRPNYRYRTLAELKQALKSAFDILLNRADAPGEAGQLLSSISSKLEREQRYDTDEIQRFIEIILGLENNQAWEIIYEMPHSLFLVLSESDFEKLLERFLPVYRNVIMTYPRSFKYAETVSKMMTAIFDNSQNLRQRAEAFKIASDIAVKMNRFAAMDICVSMIINIKEDDLALLLRDYMKENANPYIKSIEPSACINNRVKEIISGLNAG